MNQSKKNEIKREGLADLKKKGGVNIIANKIDKHLLIRN